MSTWKVDCPFCGSVDLRKAEFPLGGAGFFCRNCVTMFSEREALEHMREKPGMNPDAPAFRVLDAVKPRSRSAAARAVFG